MVSFFNVSATYKTKLKLDREVGGEGFSELLLFFYVFQRVCQKVFQNVFQEIIRKVFQEVFQDVIREIIREAFQEVFP